MQFKAFDPNVEVSGRAVRSVVNALPSWRESREALLARHGIVDLRDDRWYPLGDWLAGFEEIANATGGRHLLYAIGKAIPGNVNFDSTVDLRQALDGIQESYVSNHRNGKIGHYRTLRIDDETRQAAVECENPYPSHFDRGLLTAFANKCLPPDSTECKVTLDKLKSTRLEGADSCTFLLSW